MKSLLSKVKQVYNNITSSNTTAKQPPNNFIGYSSTSNTNTGILGTVTSSGTTYSTNTWVTYNDEEQIRKLKKKLYRIQKSGKWIHEMNEEMFNSICGMLKSEIKADNEMAREIVFSSKMCLKYRSTLAEEFSNKLWYEGYTRSTVGGHERMRITSSGNVGIGNAYWTGSLSGLSGTTSGTYTVNTNNLINSITTSINSPITAKKAAK